MSNLKNRWVGPVPPFFRKLRNIGMIIAVVGTGLSTAPVELPEILTTISSYMIALGAVIASVAQLTCEEDPKKPE